MTSGIGRARGRGKMPTTSTGIPGATASTSSSSAAASTSTGTTTSGTIPRNPAFSPQIKSLSAFNPETTTWVRYQWKMDRYFRVINITDDDTKKTLLFLVIGDDNEALIWDGCGQFTPDDLDFADLCQILLLREMHSPFVLLPFSFYCPFMSAY